MKISSVSISTVEHETGISKDALRKWEVRYGFPVPARDENGERIYTPAQLERLRLIKRVLDRGLRPAQVVPLDPAALQRLAAPEAAGDAPRELRCPMAPAVLEALRNHDPQGLRRLLLRRCMQQGLGRFVRDSIAPLNELVGEAWADGRLAIHQEHLYAETVQDLLREAMAGLPAENTGPCVLLATPSGELHTLGLLMVQALLSLAGVRCISLGSQAPVVELVGAATGYGADVVGLSFSVAFPVRRIAPLLEELRGRLDPAVAVWAGGQGAARVRRMPPGVQCFSSLGATTVAIKTLCGSV